MSKNTKVMFVQALQHVEAECYVDGITSFRSILETEPSDSLADDAMFNIGLCYLKIQQVARAREAFSKVLSDYPDATIDHAPDQREFGRTAAKALLALVELSLAEGNRTQALEYADQLRDYSESYILMGDYGEKKSFLQLAEERLSP
jgi:TolA-binding protein